MAAQDEFPGCCLQEPVLVKQQLLLFAPDSQLGLLLHIRTEEDLHIQLDSSRVSTELKLQRDLTQRRYTLSDSQSELL